MWLLLERGANLEAKDEDGAIPLHDACAGGYTKVVQLLINSANDAERVKKMLETVDAEGNTPLHHAARGEHADIIRLLLASGALPTKANLYGKLRTQDVEDFHLQMHLSESHQNTISQSCSSTKSFLHNYARTPPQSIGVKPCV
ncbi:unnamed protein product [Malus baccata var. baccata]